MSPRHRKIQNQMVRARPHTIHRRLFGHEVTQRWIMKVSAHQRRKGVTGRIRAFCPGESLSATISRQMERQNFKHFEGSACCVRCDVCGMLLSTENRLSDIEGAAFALLNSTATEKSSIFGRIYFNQSVATKRVVHSSASTLRQTNNTRACDQGTSRDVASLHEHTPAQLQHTGARHTTLQLNCMHTYCTTIASLAT